MAAPRTSNVVETKNTDIAHTTGSDANSNSNGSDKGEINDKAPELEHVTTIQEGLVTVPNIESGDEIIHKPADKDDILTHTIHVTDDPSLNSLTFRTFFLGIGLSFFGATLATIYYFKPQTVVVSTVFLAVIVFLLGEAMALVIPRKGWIGRWFNPHPFNIKEHAAITIMANAASISAQGIEVLATEQLFYDARLSGPIAVFLLFSSQFIGYGIAGLMRKVLVYPKNMLWPQNLPVNSMLETLHSNRDSNKKPLKIFLIVLAAIFCWEIVPEWIMPILTGLSIFCLANQHSAVFTNIFGGASGDEGLGLFSICLDWQYISGGYSPLYYPMDSLISQGLGICGCIVLFAGLYYSNIYEAQRFPFLSQEIFSERSTVGNFIAWPQNAVIGPDNRINQTALNEVGLPWFAATNAVQNMVTNMSVTAAIVHILLYNWVDVRPGFAWMHPKNLLRRINPRNWSLDFYRKGSEHAPVQDHYDPHYRLMFSYKALPDWWFGIILVLSIMVGLIIIYKADSTLPWWQFLVALLIGYVFLIFFGSMQGVSGVQFLIQSTVQMIGGYINPGNPVSNMYFSLYGYNSLIQGQLLSQDLKLAQYAHLAPRMAFMCQCIGTCVGVIMTYIMTNNIITNHFDVLKSVQGTNIWSGQQAQAFNSLAITWGGLSHELFSVGKRYEWMTLIYFLGFLAPLPLYFMHRKYPNAGFNNINTGVFVLYLSWLSVGINSSLMAFFLIGLGSQFYLRRYHPNTFVKYNYLVSAALDGGTSIIVFILSFAVFGAAGNTINFPAYWGNNLSGNFDLCTYTNG